MRPLTRLLALGAATLLAACRGSDPSESGGLSTPSPQPSSTSGVLGAETVVRGLENPWGLDFLPDGRMIITERPGRLRITNVDGTLGAPVSGVPAVYANGQGGLLDVALDPDFATNQLIYLTYAEPEGDLAGTSAARSPTSTCMAGSHSGTSACRSPTRGAACAMEQRRGSAAQDGVLAAGGTGGAGPADAEPRPHPRGMPYMLRVEGEAP